MPEVGQFSDAVDTEPMGTGFIVDKAGFVLTARHVPRDSRKALSDRSIQNIKLYIGLAQPNTENMRGNFTLVSCEEIEEDSRHDLTLLRMSPNPFEGPVNSGMIISGQPGSLLYDVAIRSSDRPQDGLAIAVSGYPLGQPVLITTSGAIASAWALDIEEVTPPGAPSGFKMPDFKDSYLADVSINPGNSGGPVYRIDDGAIIGVCRAYGKAPVMTDQGPVIINGSVLSYNSGLSVIVPISYGEALLARNSTQS